MTAIHHRVLGAVLMCVPPAAEHSEVEVEVVLGDVEVPRLGEVSEGLLRSSGSQEVGSGTVTWVGDASSGCQLRGVVRVSGAQRSEERRVGKEGVSKGRSRWSTSH